MELYTPIPYYFEKGIYAYYDRKNHIIFDNNLSYLLEKGLIPIRSSKIHIRFI